MWRSAEEAKQTWVTILNNWLQLPVSPVNMIIHLLFKLFLFVSFSQLFLCNLSFSVLRHLSPFHRRLSTQARCVWQPTSPDPHWVPGVLKPQVWLTSQSFIATWGETGTLIALLETDGFPLHIPAPYIMQPASQPQISVEFLVTKWKPFHLLYQQSCTLLDLSFLPPQSHMGSSSICSMDCPLRTSGKIRTAEAWSSSR